MNTFFSRLQKVLQKVNTWVILITALVTFIASHFGFLFTLITLPLWLLIIIVLTPYTEKPLSIEDTVFNITSGLRKPPVGTTTRHL